ncbi:MAG: DUF1772 domain-containing protein [Terracidiphilus sp.]|jgi:uncharacterized membrane protein
MALKICELVSIVLSALVTGVFWGPWVGLSRSMASFEPEVFLAIVRRLSTNIAPVMTFLMPVALLSIIPVLIFSYGERPKTFYLFLGGLFLFVVALGVTMLVEVPIVKQIETWTVATLPANWMQLRDRWGSFHVIRVIASIAGLALLVAGAIF